MKRYFTDAESDPKALPPATRKKLRVAAEDVKRRLSANKVVEVIVSDLDRELGEWQPVTAQLLRSHSNVPKCAHT